MCISRRWRIKDPADRTGQLNREQRDPAFILRPRHTQAADSHYLYIATPPQAVGWIVVVGVGQFEVAGS
jgi:hypothetical protein